MIDSNGSSPSSSSPSSSSSNSSLGKDIKDRLEGGIKSMIRTEKVGEPHSHSDYLTRNTMRLIEKTYIFLGGILLLFVIMALMRESIVEVVLPLFTLVIGGILGFMSKDLLRGPGNSTTTPAPPPPTTPP